MEPTQTTNVETTIEGVDAPDATITEPQSPNFLADAEGNFTSDWIEKLDLSDEIKSSESISGVKNIRDIVEMQHNAQKLIGKKTINKIPGEDSTDEERENFFRELGVPDAPENYELSFDSLPEGTEPDENLVNDFKKTSKELNFTPQQAQGVLDWFNSKGAEAQQIQQQQANDQYDQAKQQLEKEWGESFEKNISLANRVVDKFEMKDILASKGLDNDPDMTKFLAKIGESFGEDSNLGTPKGGDSSGAQAKIEAMTNDPKHPYWDKTHPGHKQAVETMQKLVLQMG